MQISEIKTYMKKNKITYDMLAEKSGLSISTIKKIFAGISNYPRIDTVQAIEKALGLSETETASSAIKTLTDSEKRLLKAFNALIPPMQEYVLEMIEKLVSQPQNVAKRA